MSEFDRLEKQAKILKERYKPGMRIELIHMGSDPQPIPDGTRGTVVGVDDIGSIMMKWDNNRSLSLIYGEDNFRVLTPEETYAERYEKLNRQFLEKLNSDVFSKVNLVELKKSYDAGDMYYPKMILKAMHETFVSVYGGDYCNADMEFVTVPAVLKTADGARYVGLVDLDISSSAEHWGSSFLTPLGMVEHDGSEVPPEHREFLEKAIPYEYWYTPFIEDDHHVDFDHVPPEVAEILSFANGEDYTQNGGIDY